MAKFKKGDRIRDTEAMRDGVIVEVDAEKPGYYAVKYDTRPQPQWNIPENYLVAANSAPVSTNAVVQNAINARTARNLRLVPFERDRVKQGDSVWYKGREFAFKGMSGSQRVRLEDVFDGEEEIVDIIDKNLKMSANARTARNATKLMTLVPSKDGNKLNDFIHYAYFTADGEWKEGDIPYVRKDMLIHGLERELEKAKTTMQAISDALKQAKTI